MSKTSSNWAALFRAPQISWRWLPVFRRNLLVWKKLAIPSLVGNIAEPLITLVLLATALALWLGRCSLTAWPCLTSCFWPAAQSV